MKKEVILEQSPANTNTKAFLSGDIEGDIIIFKDDAARPVPKKYLYDIRMLRVQGNQPSKVLDNGKTLTIHSFLVGENLGKTVVSIA